MKKLIFFVFCLLFLAGCAEKTDQYQGYVEGDLRFIASNFSGVLTDIFVKSGDAVKKDQKLFILEKYPETGQYEQAQARVRSAKTGVHDASLQLALAEKQFKRRKNLTGSITISQEDIDVAERSYTQAKAQFDRAKSELSDSLAALKVADWSRRKKTMNASVNSSVFDTFYNVGEFVPAGRPVLALLAPQDVKIVFFVPEKVLGRFKRGQSLWVYCDGCGKPIRANISFISPKPEFTPPVIFSQDTSSKLVFSIEALTDIETGKHLNPGQPVIVRLTKKSIPKKKDTSAKELKWHRVKWLKF